MKSAQQLFSVLMAIAGGILCLFIHFFGKLPEGSPELFIACVVIGVYLSSMIVWNSHRFRKGGNFFFRYALLTGLISHILTFLLFAVIDLFPSDFSVDEWIDWMVSAPLGALLFGLISVLIYGWFSFPMYIGIAYILQKLVRVEDMLEHEANELPSDQKEIEDT